MISYTELDEGWGQVTAAAAAILALAAFLWPGPTLVRWFKSSWSGVNRCSFALPCVVTFIALGLRYSMPLSRWLCSIPALFVIAAVCLYVLYGGSNSIKVDNDEGDNECKSIEDAWPERSELAKRIANCVATEGKATYAIYGEFGAGKSSMLNFVECALRSRPKENPIIVRFNGWLPGSQENLANQLFSDISTECSKRYYAPQLRHSALRLAKAIATGTPHIGGLAEWLPQETQEDIIKDLRDTLERLPERVIVLVDEIDRMQKDELFTLLKLIRGFSSLPRLSFLCALERDHVEKMICEEFGSLDHTFYHKFFVESFQLPRLVDSFLESELHDSLTAVFDSLGWFLGDAEARKEYSNSIHMHWKSIFAQLCTNARGIRRLSASVRAQAWPLQGEVNPFDLTLVAALRYFAPAALGLIWNHRDLLCANDIDAGIADPDKAYEAEVLSYFESEGKLLRSAYLLEQVKSIREVLFSGLGEIKDALGASSRDKLSAELRFFDLNKSGAKAKKLRSKSYFPAYFQDVLPGSIFPEKEMSRILDELRRSNEDQGSQLILREFKGLAGDGEKRLNFLDKLNDIAIRVLDLDRCMWVANVILSCSSEVNDSASATEYSQMGRFVASVSDELFLNRKSDVCLDFLRKCIRAARSDGAAVRVFQWACALVESVTSVQRGVQSIPRENLESSYLARMEERYGPAVGLDQVDLNFSYWQAFAEWGRMLEKSVWARNREIQRDFWRRYISSTRSGMSDFSRFVLAPLLTMQPPGQSYLVEEILPKEELRKLTQLHPPYGDPVAISCLREILGEDVIPEPLGTGNALSNRIVGMGNTSVQ